MAPHPVHVFGHLAMGNLHINVLGLDDADESVDERVLTLVAAHGGSIAAEHGIGVAKREWLSLTRSPVEIDLMRAIKCVLRPGRPAEPRRDAPRLAPPSPPPLSKSIMHNLAGAGIAAGQRISNPNRSCSSCKGRQNARPRASPSSSDPGGRPVLGRSRRTILVLSLGSVASMGLMDGKVAIVTGAGRGIGRGEAIELAREGAGVVVNELDAEVGQAVVDEIVAAGGEAVLDTGDCSEDDDRARAGRNGRRHVRAGSTRWSTTPASSATAPSSR